MYAFKERYILPISHDEVVHGKSSYLNKAPGDDYRKFASVRAFYAHMMTQPGKKLSFMSAEFGQWKQWEHQYSIDWHLLQYDRHQQLHAFFKAMNTYYLTRPCLWEVDNSWDGFQWLCVDDRLANTIVYLRKDSAGRSLLIACNFSGSHHRTYRTGIPFGSTWTLDFSTDSRDFGGSGGGNATPVKTEPVPSNGCSQSLLLDLPPMTCAIYRCVRKHPIRKPVASRKPRKKLPAKKAES
jgi:1,4-alpha-glucan branching enzyme